MADWGAAGSTKSTLPRPTHALIDPAFLPDFRALTRDGDERPVAFLSGLSSLGKARQPSFHMNTLALLAPAGWVPATQLPVAAVVVRSDARRVLTAVRAADAPAAPEFNDFERECFGDEDGCDAWFYGECPDGEECELPTDEEAAALQARVKSNFEAGRRVTAEREAKAKEADAARERVRKLARKA